MAAATLTTGPSTTRAAVHTSIWRQKQTARSSRASFSTRARPLLGNLESSNFCPLEQVVRRVGRREIAGAVVARSASSSRGRVIEAEVVFFDGGVHYGDLIANLVFGLTLVWLPLTLAAVFRGLFLRYRLTNLRVTIQSGVLGGDRKDFSYEVVKDVKLVPRFIGEWGDLAIELKDGTKLDMRCVPKFREIAKYIQDRAGQKVGDPSVLSPTGARKGFL